jgi:L-histidine N-alpha-methyltransferase
MGWRAEVLVDETTMAQGLIRDASNGLRGRPKRLAPKYFYDATGSALFERITQLPEYYLTRAERALLAAHGGEIMADLTPQELVELGAGSVAKVRSLLRAAPVGAAVLRYVPLDIDAGTIAAAGRELELEYPDLDVLGIVGDFQQHLGNVPGSVGRRLVVFFGSTIGNLDPEPRRQLLDGVRGLLCAEDRFLLGLDLVKERRVLEAAYDDRADVTAAFNRNILRVVNRGLGGDFVPEAFRAPRALRRRCQPNRNAPRTGAAPDGLPSRCGSDRGGGRRRVDLDGELVQVHAGDRRSHADRLGPRTRSLV